MAAHHRHDAGTDDCRPPVVLRDAAIGSRKTLNTERSPLMCTVLVTHTPPAGRRALIWCHDTRGASDLDDVMRTLFTDFYQRGRGFSTEDLIRVINRITRNSCEGFFSRYISGTDVPPYETIFGYARLSGRTNHT
jgi:hypothetical protein